MHPSGFWLHGHNSVLNSITVTNMEGAADTTLLVMTVLTCWGHCRWSQLKFKAAYVLSQSQQTSSLMAFSLHRRIPGKAPANPLECHHYWQPIPLFIPFYPCLTSSFQQFLFLCLTSPQICPVCITGTHCMASLKPNPQNGSGKASKVLGVRGGLPSLWKALAHLKFWTQH